MKYKVGQLVLNRKLGLGRVLEVNGDEVMTFFKDQQSNPRTINVGVVPMEIPSDQTDVFFDGMSQTALDRLKKPMKARAPSKRALAKAAATAATAAAGRNS